MNSWAMPTFKCEAFLTMTVLPLLSWSTHNGPRDLQGSRAINCEGWGFRGLDSLKMPTVQEYTVGSAC